MEPSAGPPADRRWQASRPGVEPDRRDALRPRLPDGPRLGPVRVTAPRVTLAIALGGSALFVLYGIVVRDATQIPMLSAGFAVLGIVFSALGVGGAIGTYHTAQGGESGRAVGLALLGGIAALVAAGSFAVAAVLALVWRG